MFASLALGELPSIEGIAPHAQGHPVGLADDADPPTLVFDADGQLSRRLLGSGARSRTEEKQH
jgi:hypothetical protein